MNHTPWQNLSEEIILNQVEKILNLPLNNLCLKRNSYINRVYELERKDSSERFIVKFYRPGRWSAAMIQEEHLLLQALAKAEIPVIVPLTLNGKTLFEWDGFHFALFPKMGGRALDEFNQNTWEQLGRLFARIHQVSEKTKNSKRITWTPAIATQNHFETILNNNVLPEDFINPFKNLVSRFIARSQPDFAKEKLILIHGDAHKGNLIHRLGEGLFVLDFDDICMGLPVQDLWMFLPDIPEKCEQEIEWFSSGYEQFREFNHAQLKLIPYLRGMRLIHFAAWCAVQSHESDFAEHFPEWGNARYWRDLMVDLEKILNPESI